MPYLRQASLDRAAELRQDKLNDNVAHALLALEAQGHDAGWDSPASTPLILTLNAHPETSRIRAGFSQPLSVVWHQTMAKFPPNQAGAALVHVARLLHREVVDGGAPLDIPVWPVHGYGIRTEMYTSVTNDNNPAEAICDGTFYEDPGTKEARAVTFVDVNGNAWWVVRIRGEEPEVGAGASTDEGPLTFTHGLDGIIASYLRRPFPER